MPFHSSDDRNLDVKGARGRTALHRAAHDGNLARLNTLIAKGANINLADDLGEQALQMAARMGHLDCVTRLLVSGADVNYIPSDKLTAYCESALCSAARKCTTADHVKIVDALLSAEADPNSGGPQKKYPLHAAAMNGNPEIVAALIQAGAKLHVFNGSGEYPLHCALSVEGDNSACLRILLENGANVNLPDERGRLPITYTMNGYRGALAHLQTLLDARPNLNIVDQESGMRPLDLALSQGYRKHANLIREARAVAASDSSSVEEDAIAIMDGNAHEYDSVGQYHTPENEDLSEEQIEADAEFEPIKLSVDFDWRNSPDHIRYLAYILNKPKPPYYENWFNLGGESGQDAIARFLRDGAIAQSDMTTRISFTYSVSDLTRMIEQSGHIAKGKKVDLIRKALLVASTEIEEGIRDLEFYHVTPLGAQAVHDYTDR